MTASNVLRSIGVVAAGVAGIAFWASGQAGPGMLFLLAALGGAILAGPAILGDPAGAGRLPARVTAAVVEEHRKRPGGSISDALRAMWRREG